MNTSEIPVRPLISVEGVTIRVRDRFILPDTSWEIKTGEQWAVLGPNGAGKSSLVKVLIGDLPYVRGTITHHYDKPPREAIGYVSFDLQEYLIAREDTLDMARYFARKQDDHRKAYDTIIEGFQGRPADMSMFNRIIDTLDIRYLLKRSIRYLSTGEMRKVIIARALMKSPDILILDEPFAGLDIASRKIMQETIGGLMAKGLQVILITHRQEEIFPLISHVMCIKEGRVYLQGAREAVLTPENIKALYGGKKKKVRAIPAGDHVRRESAGGEEDILVQMKQVTVRYGNVTILDCLDWTVRRGENWAVIGPNGSGKTTLLSLIAGDHPQAYANEIYLFGRRRGSGEDIWEIKEHMGIVSSELQVRYRRDISAYDVVASGLFDTMGLYRRLNQEQRQHVERWLDFFGIMEMSGRIFTRLSYGERHMTLLARAMVKSPEMLILDEPCQGLDRDNRQHFLEMVEMIGSRT
ncbi:MAG: ATP-binding cassette domain-containing protein, partial [Syntrophales bacterium]|nr:ATP-binding cassette domain-containing protein [Syntrophales bacterium]